MVDDIVGVCIYDGGGNGDDDDETRNSGEDSLIVVAETEPGLHYSLIHQPIRCSSYLAGVPSVSSFSTMGDHVLNASLQIGR